jgi:hypothetical protein
VALVTHQAGGTREDPQKLLVSAKGPLSLQLCHFPGLDCEPTGFVGWQTSTRSPCTGATFLPALNAESIREMVPALAVTLGKERAACSSFRRCCASLMPISRRS